MNKSLLIVDGIEFNRASTFYDYEENFKKFQKITETSVVYKFIIGNYCFEGIEHKRLVFTRFGFGYLYANTVVDSLRVSSNDYAYGDQKLARNIVYGNLNFDDLSNIKLSVILPAYGVNNVIENVVKAVSISCSMIPELKWECIIVDDMSEDKIIINKPNVKIIRSKQKLYSAGARNLGLKYSNGDLILFLDADTILAPNYVKEHCLRHFLFDNFITVSMRDHVDTPNLSILEKKPSIKHDSRYQSTYFPGRLGLIPVEEPITIKALDETDNFREFGYGRLLGPVDLPFMVKGNNLMMRRYVAEWLFHEKYKGYGPEDVEFAARAIARGVMVVPVLNTGVYHIDHPDRSGSKKNEELARNLMLYEQDLLKFVWRE